MWESVWLIFQARQPSPNRHYTLTLNLGRHLFKLLWSQKNVTRSYGIAYVNASCIFLNPHSPLVFPTPSFQNVLLSSYLPSFMWCSTQPTPLVSAFPYSASVPFSPIPVGPWPQVCPLLPCPYTLNLLLCRSSTTGFQREQTSHHPNCSFSCHVQFLGFVPCLLSSLSKYFILSSCSSCIHSSFIFTTPALISGNPKELLGATFPTTTTKFLDWYLIPEENYFFIRMLNTLLN